MVTHKAKNIGWPIVAIVYVHETFYGLESMWMRLNERRGGLVTFCRCGHTIHTIVYDPPRTFERPENDRTYVIQFLFFLNASFILFCRFCFVLILFLFVSHEPPWPLGEVQNTLLCVFVKSYELTKLTLVNEWGREEETPFLVRWESPSFLRCCRIPRLVFLRNPNSLKKDTQITLDRLVYKHYIQ